MGQSQTGPASADEKAKPGRVQSSSKGQGKAAGGKGHSRASATRAASSTRSAREDHMSKSTGTKRRVSRGSSNSPVISSVVKRNDRKIDSIADASKTKTTRKVGASNSSKTAAATLTAAASGDGKGAKVPKVARTRQTKQQKVQPTSTIGGKPSSVTLKKRSSTVGPRTAKTLRKKQSRNTSDSSGKTVSIPSPVKTEVLASPAKDKKTNVGVKKPATGTKRGRSVGSTPTGTPAKRGRPKLKDSSSTSLERGRSPAASCTKAKTDEKASNMKKDKVSSSNEAVLKKAKPEKAKATKKASAKAKPGPKAKPKKGRCASTIRTRSRMSLRDKKSRTANDWLRKRSLSIDFNTSETTQATRATSSSRRPSPSKKSPTKSKPGNLQKMKREEERNSGFALANRKSALFKKYFPAVRAQLQKIRFSTVLLDTYEQDGWRSANAEKLKPAKELAKARRDVRDAKKRINLLLHDLMEGPDARAEKTLVMDSDGEIDEDKIVCAVCPSEKCSDEDDILLCDLEGCNKAFHMSCLDPPAGPEEAEGEEDADWFCRRCMTMMECMNEVNDVMMTDLEWHEVFPLDKLDAEQQIDDDTMARTQATKRSRRSGRKIVPPKKQLGKKTKSAWDALSFGSESDSDDESFASSASGSESDDSSSGHSSSDDESMSDDGEAATNMISVRDTGNDAGIVLGYKRVRKTVDYKALAAKMFKDKGIEEDEDEDFSPRRDSQDFDATFSTKMMLG